MDQVSHLSPSVFLCFPCISMSSSQLPPLQSGRRRQSPWCLHCLAGQGGCPCCGIIVKVQGTFRGSWKTMRKISALPKILNRHGYDYSSLCLLYFPCVEEWFISRITAICPITHTPSLFPHRSPLMGLTR